jgi:hypothetical protein
MSDKVDAHALNDALAASFMLVDFQLRQWGAKVTDKAASAEVITSKGAARNSGKFVKNLLVGADAELLAVQQLGNAARAHVYANTVPWSNNTTGAKRGDRLINAKKTFEFLKTLNHIVQEHNAAVVALEKVWDQRVQQGLANLGGLADPGDYPTAADVASRFSISVDVVPVPSMSDFSRTSLPPELAQALGQRLADQTVAQFDNARADIKKRLLDELERMAKQLGKAGRGDKTRLYDSLVTNMQGLVGLARSMNVTGNPELTALTDKIEMQLLKEPVEVYRNHPTKAVEVANAAAQLAVDAAIDEVWK